jgi:hypothetical protein
VARLLENRFRDAAAARAYYEKAYDLQQPPQKYYTGFDFARVLRKTGDTKKADEIARLCTEGIGGTLGPRYMAGFVGAGSKEAEAVFALLEKHLAAAEDPREKVDLLLLKSDLLLRRDPPEPKAALAVLDAAEKVAGEHRFTRFDRERIWSAKCLLADNHLKDRAMQEKYLGRLLGLKPRYDNYRLWRAIWLARYGESKAEAWRAFERIPPRRNLAYNRACFLANVGEPDRALDLLRQAIADLPDASARNRQRRWAEHDDEFTPLRALPAFKKILKPEEE